MPGSASGGAFASESAGTRELRHNRYRILSEIGALGDLRTGRFPDATAAEVSPTAAAAGPTTLVTGPNRNLK